MLMLGIEIDGSDKTGIWRDRLPMLMLGIVIEGSARLVLGIVIEGSTRLVLGIVIDGSAKLIELRESDGILIKLSDGGDKLMVDGRLIEGSAILIELNEARPVLMDSDGIDKDESPAKIPLMPMLESRGVGIDKKPDGLIEEGMEMLGIGRILREAVQVVEAKPPMATRLQFPYGAIARPLFVGSKTAYRTPPQE